jgi:hypothetical protein
MKALRQCSFRVEFKKYSRKPIVAVVYEYPRLYLGTECRSADPQTGTRGEGLVSLVNERNQIRKIKSERTYLYRTHS